jgi:penicillin G amidase
MKRHLAASAFIVFLFLGSSAAQTSLTVSGLTAPVRVGRDARSIPYINAKNDADLYFAQGYVMASDRLWQMDIMRRLARGETSELFGQLTLEEDKRWRRFGFASIAEENLKYLSSSLHRDANTRDEPNRVSTSTIQAP